MEVGMRAFFKNALVPPTPILLMKPLKLGPGHLWVLMVP